MKPELRKLPAALLLTALLLGLAAPPAEAQFLKKLSKGLEKVNRGLEKVNDVLDPKSESKSGDRQSDDHAAKTQPVPAAAESDAPTPEAEAEAALPLETAAAKPTAPQFHVPHFDDRTRFLALDPASLIHSRPTVTDSHEGIFAVQTRSGWSFYRTEDGRCLFRDIAGSGAGGSSEPYFSCGVAVMRSRNSNGNSVFILLYADGRIKELPGEWRDVQNFVDGLSMVKTFDANYIPSVFYIDVNGRKTLPALSQTAPKMTSAISTHPVRPLRDGRRGFRKDGKWGFLDAEGNIKIDPRFAYIRDFSEGYAVVTVQQGNTYKLALIDTEGRYAIPPSLPAYNMEIGSHISDVHDGRIRYVDRYDVVYYDTAGNTLARFVEGKGTPFNGGLAMMDPETSPYGESLVHLLDPDMQTVGLLNDYAGFYDVDNNNPRFSADGLAVVNLHHSVIDTRGRVVLQHMPDYAGVFGAFGDDGYSLVESKFDGHSLRGFVRTDGSYSVVITTGTLDVTFSGDYPDNPYNPPYLREPQPEPRRPEPPVDSTPLGPKEYSIPSYNVTVSASPAEGGTVTGTGTYRYGDIAQIGGTPCKGWRRSHVETSDGRILPEDRGIPVTGDIDAVVHFIAEDDIEAPAAGIWQGTYRFSYLTPEGETIDEQIPLYLEMQSSPTVETPYGKRYGFLTLIFDPDKRYRTGKKSNTSGGAQYNLMQIPMTVEGMIVVEGTKYLLLDGGEFKLGNLLVEAGTNDGGINAAAVNLMLLLFGNDLDLDGGSYRLAIRDQQPDGLLHLGLLERFSPLYGWLPAGDQRFLRKISTSIMRGYDLGLPYDYFDGEVLSPCDRRDDILWYTPLSWLNGDRDAWLDMKQRFDRAYTGLVSDYRRFIAQ